jgi:hypothetical protein
MVRVIAKLPLAKVPRLPGVIISGLWIEPPSRPLAGNADVTASVRSILGFNTRIISFGGVE